MYYDELIEIPINGIKQWIYIRGVKKENPVLLVLHGGPGFPGIAFSSVYSQKLEEYFTIVQWDQRGAGKTYTHSDSAQKLTIQLALSDLFQLLDYIALRFGQEKVNLIGHSWGTLLGMRAISHAPHRFERYIGIGQFVNLQQNSKLCYQYCLEKANLKNDSALMESLIKLGTADDCAKWDLEHQNAARLGGALHNKTDLMPVAELFFKTTLYTEDEKQHIPQAMIDSCMQLYDEMSKVDLVREIKSVAVPIMFLSGIYDCYAVTELVKKYFDALQAPQKKLILFENSAHFPFLEEPDIFTAIVCEWFI